MRPRPPKKPAARHTPGPWTIGPTSVWGVAVKAVTNGDPDDRIAVAVSDGHDLAEAHANATLIAAAPDLLKALQDMVLADEALWDEDTNSKRPEMLVARAAIEKARPQAIKGKKRLVLDLDLDELTTLRFGVAGRLERMELELLRVSTDDERAVLTQRHARLKAMSARLEDFARNPRTEDVP